MQTRLRSLLVVSATALSILTGCGKEDFTKPSPTTFSFLLQGTSNSIDYLSFSKINMSISEFEFEGMRNDAPDFFFEEVFTDDLQLEWPAVVEMLDFEIPQGVYESIEISFKFSESSNQSILLEGIYTSSEQNRNVWMQVEINRGFQLELLARNADGSGDISFSTARINQASIEFDATGLLDTISRERLEQAVAALDSDEVLVISDNFNSDITDVLEAQLPNYVGVVFN